MGRKRAKKGKEPEDSNTERVVDDVDRISQLPDPVLYHILSFVPTVYVVRMSVVSRRWRRMWHSVPTLEFSHVDFKSFGFQHEASFNMFVEKCLKHRRRAMRFIADSSVTSFKLDIHSCQEWFAGLNRWFHSSIVMNNVKELDLHRECEQSNQIYYSLPSAVLNGRSLIHLRLDGEIEISPSCSVNLPFLKSLYLKNIVVDKETIYNLVIRSPFLEKCELVSILAEGNLRISSSSLKLFKMDLAPPYEEDVRVEALKIEAVNLQCLVIYSYHYDFRYDFSATRAIKDLSVHDLCETRVRDFENQISELAQLEKLSVVTMNDIDDSKYEMNISHRNLKHFSFRTEGEFALTISAPNLVSFRYSGSVKLSMSMCNTEVNGHFEGLGGIWNYKSDCTELITFLSNINCSWKSVCLHVYNHKTLMVPKNMRTTGTPPLPTLKHLKVVTDTPTTRNSELRKSLKWICPSLETLSIEKSNNN